MQHVQSITCCREAHHTKHKKEKNYWLIINGPVNMDYILGINRHSSPHLNPVKGTIQMLDQLKT